MSEKKKNPGPVEDKERSHCTEECMIGLVECTECGPCAQCSGGAHLDEDELPSHWLQFIKKITK
ncbi:MAG: hypothetical protein ACHQ6U_12775 [Thermodesulfobacteriota bacterium]